MIRVVRTSQLESNYEQVLSLDGTDYRIRLLWNERDAHWYLTLRDSAGADIATGFKVVADIPLLVHVADDRMPPGDLWVADTTGSQTDPGLRDLGGRVLLVYVEAAE